MANIKSAKKRVLVNQAKALKNKMVKSALKTAIKKAYAADEANKAAAVAEAIKKVDQACAKGILHANCAARKKSQLAKLLNA